MPTLSDVSVDKTHQKSESEAEAWSEAGLLWEPTAFDDDVTMASANGLMHIHEAVPPAYFPLCHLCRRSTW